MVLLNSCSSVGRAIALGLTECGANVALVDHRESENSRLAEDIMNQREVNEKRGRAGSIFTNWKDEKSVQDVISRCAEAFGGIDILVDANCHEKDLSFSKDFDVEKLNELIQMNLRASLVITHKAVQFLKGRKRGRIIYLLQDLYRLGFEGDSLSAATRTGLIHFSKVLSKELHGDNVTVNCVATGPTEEYLLAKRPGKSLKAAQDDLLSHLKPSRVVENVEIANLVCYLASPLASSITGQTLSASAGLTFVS